MSALSVMFTFMLCHSALQLILMFALYKFSSHGVNWKAYGAWRKSDGKEERDSGDVPKTINTRFKEPTCVCDVLERATVRTRLLSTGTREDGTAAV